MKGLKQIKNYILTKQIREDHTGCIYQAIDQGIQSLVSIKVIPSSQFSEKKALECLKREVKNLYSINHKNIAKLIGLEKTVNNMYLIMDYCNGGNLQDYLAFYKKIKGQALTEKCVQKIVRQLVEAIEYLSENNPNLLLSGIKLENIWINFDKISNVVKDAKYVHTVDYNKVSLDDDISIKISVIEGVDYIYCGTPNTLSEQKSSSQFHISSLGAITYELLTGRPPISLNNLPSLLEQMKIGNNIPKYKLSEEAIRFINRSFQLDPKNAMSLNEIKSHPFLIKDSKNFNLLELYTVDMSCFSLEELQVLAKDCNNLLWMMYKANPEDIHLDKIGIDSKDMSNMTTELKDEKPYDDELQLCDDVDLALEKDNVLLEVVESPPSNNNKICGKIFNEIKTDLKKKIDQGKPQEELKEERDTSVQNMRGNEQPNRVFTFATAPDFGEFVQIESNANNNEDTWIDDESIWEIVSPSIIPIEYQCEINSEGYQVIINDSSGNKK